jgi:phospholipid/cholesterol/gamma-HCH transport system permease protein
MCGEVLKQTFSKAPNWKLAAHQLVHVGVFSLPVVAITGFSTGLVLAAQSFFQLSDKGLADVTGLMVAKALATELGPILTAFMVTGRVGAAMCAELGTMRVTEQIDAMRSMAISPINYLVVPRIFSTSLMLPLLTTFSCFMGMIGGYLLSVYFFKMPSANFINPIPVYVNWFDVFTGLFKALFFGFLIASVACFKGLQTRGGAAGVGKTTTSSVVITYTFILISNFLITIALNLFRTNL